MMAQLKRCGSLKAAPRGTPQPFRLSIFAAATKSGKGFGKPGKQKEEGIKGHGDGATGDKQVIREATAVAAGREKYRPVRADEASRGKYDYVQVADWGDGDRAKLGNLRLVSHVPQYEGGASGSSSSSGGGEAPRPFHMQLAHQLKLAEARGALAVAGPPPPPLSEWSFREDRYAQFLADQLEVHLALEGAIQEAAGAVAPPTDIAKTSALLGWSTYGSTTSTYTSTCTSSASSKSSTDSEVNPQTAATAATAAAAVAAVAAVPQQCALRALQHLAPGKLGLERSAALHRDLAALLATVGHPAAVEVRALRHRRRVPAAPKPQPDSEVPAQPPPPPQHQAPAQAQALATQQESQAGVQQRGQEDPWRGEAAAATARAAANQQTILGGEAQAAPAPGPMARSYAQVLRRLGRLAGAGESQQERQAGALRLMAHAAVLHLVGQAAGVRVGAAAAEQLALLQRRAAALYHEYPEAVSDPRVTLSHALDAAGQHLGNPVVRQVVFDELPSAMQKTGLLMAVLAHRD